MKLCVLILMCLALATSFLINHQVGRNSYVFNALRRFALSATKKGEALDGTRINKCVIGMSRRAADACIEEGRVTINGVVASPGSRVTKGSIVKVDGLRQKWETLEEAKASKPNQVSNDLVYLKYWKPVGVTCTAEKNDRNNIISVGGFDSFSQRLFTVGRLDKDSSGLILLTSDGRVNVAMLNHANSVEKLYRVEVNQDIRDSDIRQLEDGIEISVPSLINPNRMISTVTSPCKVRRSVKSDPRRNLEMTLVQGRNRQVRRMIEAVGNSVVTLHRVSFAGITLRGLKGEGSWKLLNNEELQLVETIIKKQSGVTEAVEEE